MFACYFAIFGQQGQTTMVAEVSDQHGDGKNDLSGRNMIDPGENISQFFSNIINLGATKKCRLSPTRDNLNYLVS